jgi:hypothetical protein
MNCRAIDLQFLQEKHFFQSLLIRITVRVYLFISHLGSVPTCTEGRVLGHEGIGFIEAVGSHVHQFKVGDKA